MATASGGYTDTLCGHCSTKFKLTEENATCAFCKRAFHLHCVSGTTGTEDMIKFCKKPNASIFQGCPVYRAGIKQNKETIYNENQFAEKLKIILDEKVSNKIQKITDEHITQKGPIMYQMNLIRGYKNEIKDLQSFKEQAVVALEAAEINKLKIIEFQKEIENLKIAHGNPAKRARTSNDNFEPIPNNASLIKDLEPVFEKITSDITKTILTTIKNTFTLQTTDQDQNRQRTNDNQRTRSVSKNRLNSQKLNVNFDFNNSTNKTFAVIVAEKADKAATIRTLIMPEKESVKNQFLKDNLCAEINIIKINNKSKNLMTVKCATSDDAINLEQKIKEKYRGHIQVNKVYVKLPQIKITNLPMDLSDQNIMEMLKEQNYWPTNANLNLIRSYNIKLNSREYKNLIITCDITTQKEFIERGTAIVGFQERRCFENVTTIQCLHYYRFGHMQADCTDGCTKEFAS